MTEDYVSLYINTALVQNDPLSALSLMFLFFGRMMPIILLVPFFGAKVLPHSVKAALAISFFVIFFPQLIFVTKTKLDFNLMLLLYMLKELFVGVLLGFILSLPFIIVQNSGILIDHQRGGASLMVNDPTMQNQSSPLGTLFNLILIYLFFMIDGPFTVLDIISQSYNVLPPDKFLAGGFFDEKASVYSYVMRIMGHVMILSTQLAAPALIMILMADFFLGIANRLAPQVQITFLGMPLKSLLALVIVFFGWKLFTEEAVAQCYKALNVVADLVMQFKPSSG